MLDGDELNEPTRSRGISLSPLDYEALRRMAFVDGHTSRSRIVQELIDREMTDRVGEDWRRQLLNERLVLESRAA